MSTGGDAIDRGLAFLAAQQDATGTFPALRASDLTNADEVVEEDNPFGTAQIVHSVSGFDSPVAREIAARGVACLRAGMEPGGVWRHWRDGHPRFDVVPADVDDTAWLSSVLRRHGVAVPDNR